VENLVEPGRAPAGEAPAITGTASWLSPIAPAAGSTATDGPHHCRSPAHDADMSRTASVRPALGASHLQPPILLGPRQVRHGMLGPPPLRQQWQSAAHNFRQGGTAMQPPLEAADPKHADACLSPAASRSDPFCNRHGPHPQAPVGAQAALCAAAIHAPVTLCHRRAGLARYTSHAWPIEASRGPWRAYVSAT
jgi:hypothetical protein